MIAVAVGPENNPAWAGTRLIVSRAVFLILISSCRTESCTFSIPNRLDRTSRSSRSASSLGVGGLFATGGLLRAHGTSRDRPQKPAAEHQAAARLTPAEVGRSRHRPAWEQRRRQVRALSSAGAAFSNCPREGTPDGGADDVLSSQPYSRRATGGATRHAAECETPVSDGARAHRFESAVSS